jgi:hypothetical protein
LIEGHGLKKGQTLVEPKVLLLNRRQKRAMGEMIYKHWYTVFDRTGKDQPNALATKA